MAKLFVFGIGGTGSRVIRSLVMLMAAGARIQNCDKIVPIIIDPDTQNGDMNRTVELLKTYKHLHDALGRRDEGFFHTVMNLNLKSVVLMTRAVVPHMSAGAAIVNFASLAGRDGGGPGAAMYATSKAAVMTFTRAMAKELGPKGIRVNALCCGMIATRFHDEFTKPEVRQAVANGTPLRREGTSQEAADVAVFLASDAAGFMTGANVDVNGGTFFS